MAVFGMGCFWGAEKMFWSLPGIFSTQVGYAGGFTPNPTYKEVCTGNTSLFVYLGNCSFALPQEFLLSEPLIAWRFIA
uniref:peptide-methionine (S)-S-oxide reductase n=1 Tax=Chelonoidis abingdonii TaxID=106734 RepID=A0A8C0GRL8_CHEAB